jgi:hypothetical protein
MIATFIDPLNPTRIGITQTITFYLDKVLERSLADEIEKVIRAQAVKDLKHNPEVRKVIAEEATKLLLAKLGVEEKPVSKENSNEHASTSRGTDGPKSVPQDRSAVSQ